MVVRWTFTDPSTSDSWTFDVNPTEDNTPGFKKGMTYGKTTAGKTLVFEGQDEIRQGGFSGHITTEAEYNTLYTWWEKRNQIQMADDLGRQSTIIVDSFTPKRQRSHRFPWKHSYDVTYTIISW